MAVQPPITEEPDLRQLEERAVDHLTEDGVLGVPDVVLEELEFEEPPQYIRLAFVIAFPMLAAATMAGGVFIGFSARIYAAIAGVLGITLGMLATRIRRVLLMNFVILGGLFLIGVVLVIPTGVENVTNLASRVVEAATSGDVVRPPVTFAPGWHAIVAWLMSGLGLAAAWVAVELKKPSIATLVPIPVVAIAAISVPKSQQLGTGIASLVLFALGLGLLSGVQSGAEEQGNVLSHELRRAAKALPIIAAVTVILFFLARSNILFPPPRYDPAQEAKKPKAVPLSEVEDRVLFTVDSNITGPWRMGHLDVYDGTDWRLPPFAESRLKEVPESGVVDRQLRPGTKATFELKGLSGAVLPGLPNMVGVIAEGPFLAYDGRTGNLRVAQGQVEAGVKYTVTAAKVPPVEELQQLNRPIPQAVRKFLDIPPPPPAVAELLRQAPTTSAWDKMDFLRQTLLKTVVAKGTGTPVSVEPETVQDMLAGSKEGTPFEIVAGQAMLARWAGVPSRIGYGFDNGDKVGELLEVRPKHGATFLEVYFPTFKWLPVVGNPVQAKSSFSDAPQQTNSSILPSDEISVQLFIPVILDPESILVDQVKQALLIGVPIVLLLLIAYYTWPAIRKSMIRGRRRAWAQQAGFHARIAVAYAELRELSTDLGYRYDSDTPLMYLDRVVADDEHTELAWLVTRGLWGDLQGMLGAEDAHAAEELARTLKKRMSQAHPFTLRAIAAVSRSSIRHPYAPALGVDEKKKTKRKKETRLAAEAA